MIPESPRIAIVSHAHPSVSKGGAEIAAHSLFRGMRALGLPALFLAAVPQGKRRELVLGGEDEQAVFFDPEEYDHFLQLGSPAIAQEVTERLRAFAPEAVSFHHFLNLGLGTLRQVRAELAAPAFLTLHEFLAICGHHGQMVTRPERVLCERASVERCGRCLPEHDRQEIATRAALMRRGLLEMDGLVSPSRFLAGRFVEWGVPAARIAVVENGLRDAGEGPAPPRRAGGPVVFGYFGQINPFKGVALLLEAVRLLGADAALAGRIEIRLHGNVIGMAPEFEAELAGVAAEHRFLRLMGPYDNASVRRLMAATDAVLVPSTWWENSPLVIQEAFGAGRPVICAGIGGMAEKVADGLHGLHFEAGSAASLADALRRAATGGDAAFAAPPRPLDEAQMARAYLDAFAGLMAGRPSPGGRWSPPAPR